MHPNKNALAIILNIETSTTNCSVAIADKGQVLHSIEMNDGYKHAEQLMPFVNEVMGQSGISFQRLDAVAVSSGPGSYTGLRIGVATAKGIAYALDKPLIALNSLEIMTNQVMLNHPTFDLYVPMLDARRMEVYTAAYGANLKCILDTSSLVIDSESFNEIGQKMKVIYFGDGSDKCTPILKQRENFTHLTSVYPSAAYMAILSFKKLNQKEFESLAYFEPNYLKEFQSHLS